ncbi:site-specific DNA-methyltransferase [Endozoicomonas sp. G2_2]|uniref:DNA-methyltransferase n=1 Tax=Endozoicomonas sp. G2_2 TaxID=2821092 RepID=UPI001ADCFC7C|nr:site-specific DNA-methyltransferase [Endozoicomonas sp. G2_2]MBO9471510.1 site-specific DNA-methyltransferase [Endozoicomonas sp. G2_2]
MTAAALPTVDDHTLVEALAQMTYADVAASHGVSRGRVYNAAVRLGARKHEVRIQERRRERAARQQAFLAEVLQASHKADVLDFLDGMPDNCVQLHLTSIPYNVGKAYGGSDTIDRRRHHFYLGFMLQTLSEMTRTLAPGGVLFLQVGSTRMDDGGLMPLDCVLLEHLRAMGLTFQNRVVWTVPHGLTPKHRLSGRHEVALVLSKGEPKHFNANAARVPQKQPGKRAFKGANKGALSGNPLGAHPSDVWADIGNVGHNHPDRAAGGGHPAQYPTMLARRAILLYTHPGELVVDVFDGSGTTTAVAKAEGRSFVGCDLFYEDVRAQRLANVAPSLQSALPGVTEESLAVWQAEATPRAHLADNAPRATQQALLDLV